MRIFGKVVSIILVVLFAIMIPVNVVVRMFDNTIAAFTGGTFWKLVKEDKNAIYHKMDFESEEEMIAAGKLLCYQVEAEGAALLLNNDNALPLKSGAKVSTLSTSSINLVYGGTGSGNVDASKADNLKAALEKSGFEVNETLWNFYVELGLDRSASAGESAVLAGQAGIAEAPMSAYTEEVKNSISEYGDAVIITFSRVGGEGYDLAFDPGLGDGYNYLALDENEKDLLSFANDLKAQGKINNIIVLINSSNALQVDFLKDYDIDACLWVGGLGISGTNAVTDILAGKINPSGSIVDTYCYDNYSSPAMQNFIPTVYEGYEEGIIPNSAKTYMIYQEGIYVGYKYYETRYEDAVMGTGNAGNYKYSDDVAFPFGHGLSYTTFEYSDMSVVYDSEADQYRVTLKVSNVGSVAGKETVQIYAQSPYTQYDKDNKVEKASVQLCGFGKTDIIAPGESEIIAITVDKRDLASYDAYGYGTYIMDAGDYYLTVATDAHNAVNNILSAKGYTTADGMDANGNSALTYKWTEDELDAVTYSTSLNGTKIENQLQDADLNSYMNGEVIKYLSRSDWNGTWPTEIYKIALTEQMILELAEGRWNIMGEDYYEIPEEWKEMPVLNAKNGLTLYDMFDADYDNDGVKASEDYDDPAWDKLLENLTMDELISIGDCFHWRMPIKSINAPGSRDENGPQGLTVALFGAGLGVEATAFTSEDVMAATFNTELMYNIGNMIGNNCLAAKVSCLYGPGANTHRTPYGGRNFEYYSEDGFLAGEIGGAEVQGIQDKGIDVVMKHFALNDCEQDRLGQAAWIGEQAAREIYLKAFQKSLEESDGNGVMTAYTRWGTTWSGAHQGLMTNILRGEWGNQTMSITDNILVTYTDAVDAVIAGGVSCFDAMLWYATDSLKAAKDDPVAVNAMVNAMHHNLFTLIDSGAMNGIGADTVVKPITPGIIHVATIVTIVFGILGIGGLVLTRKKKSVQVNNDGQTSDEQADEAPQAKGDPSENKD
jgi:beta-glucosidase